MFANILENLLKVLIQFFFKLVFFIQGKPDTTLNMKRAVNLYKGTGFPELFTYIRLWDSPHQTIEQLVPKAGVIVDLGCGDGFLANYLAISSNKRKVYGIELNYKRIKEANKNLKNTKFYTGNILKKDFPKANAILLIHVLHHLSSYTDQEKLLKKCFKKLNFNGKLIIAEIDKKPLLKYLFTYLTDALIVPILFDKKIIDKNIYYRSEKQWISILQNNGFKTKSFLSEEGKPFSHILIVSNKIKKKQNLY